MKTEPISADLTIYEGETPTITITGQDGAGDVIATANIDSINLRIDDYFSDTAIKAVTDLGKAANPVSYTLLAAESKIVTSERAYEYRFLTFDFAYDSTKHITMQYIIKVINLEYRV